MGFGGSSARMIKPSTYSGGEIVSAEKKQREDKEKDKELIIDLDSLSPNQHRQEDKSVKFMGTVYKIVPFNRLSIASLLEVLDLEQSLVGKDYVDQLKLAMAQIKILVPDMPEEVRGQLNAQQIQYLAQEVYAISSPPPESSGDTPGSGS